MAPKAPYLKSIITGVALTLGTAGLVACEREVDNKEVEGIVQKRLEEEKALNENATLKARVAELEAEVAELKATAEEKETKATAAATTQPTAKPAATAKPAPKKAATVAAAEKKEAVKNLKEKLTGGSGGK